MAILKTTTLYQVRFNDVTWGAFVHLSDAIKFCVEMNKFSVCKIVKVTEELIVDGSEKLL